MTVPWLASDLHHQFDLFEAACWWLEIPPRDEHLDDPPDGVPEVFFALKRFIGGDKKGLVFFDDHTGKVIYPIEISNERDRYFFPQQITREQLIMFADSVGQKPRFLFPEMRVEITSSSNPLPSCLKTLTSAAQRH
jgi:hypothetical protein